MIALSMESSKKLLLVGLGSIGITHFKKASRKFKSITVVDVDESKQTKVEELSRTQEVEASYLQNLDEIEKNEFFDLIVLANYGPDHYTTYKKLSTNSSHFLIEKPLTSKISDLLLLRREVSTEKIVITNLQWNYSGFKDKVLELREKNELGEIQGLQLLGGAKCLVTNGIHYLALSSQLLDSCPSSVLAMTESAKINPRRSDFAYYGGISAWRFPGNRFLSMHLQNESQVSEAYRVLFQNGIIEVRKGQMTTYSIPSEDRQLLVKPSKTLHALRASEAVDAFTFSNDQDGLDEIYKRFAEGSFLSYEFESGYNATLGILASLYSSRTGTLIDLENSKWIHEIDSELDWNIT